MASKKKKAAPWNKPKKKAAPKPKPAPKPEPKPEPKPKGVPGVIYYRDGAELYRINSQDIDWNDLSVTPKGEVDHWNGVEWLPAKMPAGVKHTKNVAGVGG